MDNTLKILFSGDYAPSSRFEKLVLDKKENIFSDALNLIKESDISFVNLECPLTKHNIPIKKSGPHIKANPGCVEALKFFDIVGLANNHSMDFGSQGLQDTISACNSYNLHTVGAGMNLEEAQKVKVIKRKDFNIAIIAIAEHEFSIANKSSPGAAPLDVIENTNQILEAKKEADLVFVTIHGGNEYFQYPRPNLRKVCKYFIEIGVDGIFCHHPHVPGSYEIYKEKPIVYGMGNLIFDNKNPPKGWDKGYMVSVSFDAALKQLTNFEIFPYEQSIATEGIKLLENTEKKEFMLEIQELNNNLANNQTYVNEWEKFTEKKAKDTLVSMFFPYSFRGLSRLTRFLPIDKFINPNKEISKRLNLLRCESHQELLQSILEKKYKD
jgi:poly-gamma-glutamate capsule biosynthesis protein CapA/YwtB (metallophosphatase superfamily)